MAGSVLCLFFFFKQKTAYEMRISDWSSDVCSSDLDDDPGHSWPRDYFGVAVGAISVPRYSGGGENRVLPGFYVRGRVDGYSFSTRGTNLQVKLIRTRTRQRPRTAQRQVGQECVRTIRSRVSPIHENQNNQHST